MRAFLIVLGCLLGLLLFRCFLPLRVQITLEEQGEIVFRFWFFRYRIILYGKEKKQKRKRKMRKASGRKKKKSTDDQKNNFFHKTIQEKGALNGTVWLLDILKKTIKRVIELIRKGTIERFSLRVLIAGDDAAETAMTYGAVSSVVYPFVGVLNAMIPIEKQEVRVLAVYENQPSEFACSILLRLRFYRIFGAVISLIKEYIF